MATSDDYAKQLQQSIRRTEREQLNANVDYSEQQIRIAVVHAREDIVLMASYLSSISTDLAAVSKNIQSIKGWISIIGWLAIAVFVALIGIPWARSMGWLH